MNLKSPLEKASSSLRILRWLLRARYTLFKKPLKGALAHGVSSFPKYFVFASLCSFICLQAVHQLLGPVCKATWNGCPSYSASYFTSRFVIDFLSIRKVIIFSAIATDDRHPLRSRSIHQNAANCMMIRFRYIAQPRGVRKTYCARSRNDFRRLTSRSNGMPSKKIMEFLRTFVFVESVLRRGRMFQGSDGV